MRQQVWLVQAEKDETDTEPKQALCPMVFSNKKDANEMVEYIKQKLPDWEWSRSTFYMDMPVEYHKEQIDRELTELSDEEV